MNMNIEKNNNKSMNIEKIVQKYIYWPEINNPYQEGVDISNVSGESLIPLFKEVITQKKSNVVESALKFYGLNEALATIRENEDNILNIDNLNVFREYTEEIKHLSKKMFSYIFVISMMEARHAYDYKKLKRLKIDYDDEVERYSTYDSAPEKLGKLKETYQTDIEEIREESFKFYFDIDKPMKTVEFTDNVKTKFKLFFDMIWELSQKTGYSRSGIQSNLLVLLEKEPYNKLTIKDLLESAQIMYTRNNFESGYGGKAWADIAEHGKNFVMGKLNAEVFIDQAFSLEHNGGQIFNKNIIFEEEYSNYWNTFESSTQEIQGSGSKSYRISNIQIYLNAQHQGQLLNLLNINFSDLKTNLYALKNLNEYERAKKLKIIPLSVSYISYTCQIDSCISLTNQFAESINSFKEKNPNFINNIKKFDVNIGGLDLVQVLNGVNTVNSGKIELSEQERIFLNFFNYHANNNIKNTKVHTTEELFYFKYLDTKKIEKEELTKEFLGNKALGLAQMHEMNLPVPEAIVFPTKNAIAYYEESIMWKNSLEKELPLIIEKMQDSNGNPIACSVRSGASVSMPGMMDTILNVGIDDSNYDYFCKKMGKDIVNESIKKFMDLFTKSYFGEEIEYANNFNKALFQFKEVLYRNKIEQNFDTLLPLTSQEQLGYCLEAVFKSWHSERANAYRNHHNIDHDIGTAAIVQQMVFGNLNEKSCTGVVFSRDCISGDKGIIGEFLPKAQGEDVVSGAVTPLNIVQLKDFNPKVYEELMGICERLEKDTGDIQDIEFTVEDGKLYILQKRKAVCSAVAEMKLNKELFELGLISKEKMLLEIKVESLISRDVVDIGKEKDIGIGLVGNPGILRGIVVRNESDMLKYSKLYEENKRDSNFGWIFYAPETSPNHAPIMIKTQAFITSNGGFTSHAAILARSWDKPCIVGMGNTKNPAFTSGSIITVDANNGKIYSGILPLKESNSNDMQIIINQLLEHYNIDLEESINKKINFTNKILEVLNENKTWMEEYKDSVKLVNTEKANITKFCSLSQKVALFIAKSNEDLQKGKISDIIDKVIKEEDIILSTNNISKESENFELKGKKQTQFEIGYYEDELGYIDKRDYKATIANEIESNDIDNDIEEKRKKKNTGRSVEGLIITNIGHFKMDIESKYPLKKLKM